MRKEILLPSQQPYKQVDAICLDHDENYGNAIQKRRTSSLQKDVMIIKQIKPKHFHEIVDKGVENIYSYKA